MKPGKETEIILLPASCFQISLSMSRLLFATRNSHKTRELAQLLGQEFSVRDLTSLIAAPEIVESGDSFEENAAIKALTLSRSFPEEIVVADDSGLEVDARGGAPGIFSARYAGEGASDQQNIEKLLREMASSPDHTGARFRCVIAVANGGKLLTAASGEVSGNIVAPARGTNGFGYDPIFVPKGFSQTFAELSTEVKNRISHRARAARKLLAFLKTVRRQS
jgi:XTP/dITP diphosphohydrolase